MRSIRRWYARYKIWAKVGGVVVFLVVLASLYVLVLSGPRVGYTATTALDTPTPGAALTGLPSPAATFTPPPTATPIAPPRYQVQWQTNVPYVDPPTTTERLDLCLPVGATGPRPGVILIHDVGTTLEDKAEYATLCP